MPLYEYLCNQCNERLEIIQGINDAPFSVCPRCGGELKKLLSAPAIQFKGSGFYKTDYASSSSSSSSSTSSSTSTSNAAPASGSSSTGSNSGSSSGSSGSSE